MARDLDLDFPAISDLRRAAKKRMPHFAFEYLDSSTGDESGFKRNRQALDKVGFMPDFLKGALQPNLATRFLGQDFSVPFGIAPVGMSGLIWPRAEFLLSETARADNLPYCLSTVTVATPEDIGPIIGANGWFQLYVPASRETCLDMLERVKKAGFSKLIVTVDVPGEARRERQRRAQVSMPPKMTPSILWAMLTHPRWSLNMARVGAPRLNFMESYISDAEKSDNPFEHAGRAIRGWPDFDYLKFIRQNWASDLIVKGVMDDARAPELVEAGVDAIWVSNHSARQSAAAPASLHQLQKIRKALGPNYPLIFDSGIAGGLDVMRALANGADFVMLGRAFHYAVGGLAAKGPSHLVQMLKADMIANLEQIGLDNLHDLPKRMIEI